MCFRVLAFSEANLSSLLPNSGIVTSLLNFVAFLVIEFFTLDRSCSSTCFWILPFFVPQIIIEPCCFCFECCFYINRAISSIFSCLSTFTLGCSILCMLNSLHVFVSTFFQFWDFPVNDAKTILRNWGCKTIDSFYFVSSIELGSQDQSCSPFIFFSYLRFHFAMLDTISFIYTQVREHPFLA